MNWRRAIWAVASWQATRCERERGERQGELVSAVLRDRGEWTHVRAELEVRRARADVGVVRVVEVAVEDLLREGERAVEAARDDEQGQSQQSQHVSRSTRG